MWCMLFCNYVNTFEKLKKKNAIKYKKRGGGDAGSLRETAHCIK